jgi:hypothetical protein
MTMAPRGATPGDGEPKARRESVSIAVIIRRDLAPVAAHLRDEFSGLASLVAVIIDRRYRDRRGLSAAERVRAAARRRLGRHPGRRQASAAIVCSRPRQEPA